MRENYMCMHFLCYLYSKYLLIYNGIIPQYVILLYTTFYTLVIILNDFGINKKMKKKRFKKTVCYYL